MKKSFLVVTVLTAALVGGLFFHSPQVNAAPAGDSPRLERGERHEKGGEHFLARMTEVLNLSAEQQEKIKAIMEEHRNKVAPLRQSLDENRDKLRQAAKADNFDEAAVRALATSQATTKTELIVERTRMQSRIHALLTPEQRKLAEEMLDRRMEHRGGGHHGKRGK
ncbi:MAG TPA: Spy/CpxP family protein refolding chaperone [Desulfuromonadales bacterium]|nr:Spy/CpxP family protein refolding chaperone [Desulfuromonadales bacterium]